MANTLYNYPPQSEFNRIVAKDKIFQYAKPNTAIKNRFTEQVERIRWQYKLSPDTINLPAKYGIKEIQVFTLTLKTKDLHESVLRTIDKGINFPIIFQLIYKEKIKTTLAYKRPCDHDKTRWVVDSYFESDWTAIDAKRNDLPVAVNLASLYEQILRAFLPLIARENETLKEQIERANFIRVKKEELGKLQSRINKEKQFNRKVEINKQMRSIKAEIEKRQ